jgi:hypothetical protein
MLATVSYFLPIIRVRLAAGKKTPDDLRARRDQV